MRRARESQAYWWGPGVAIPFNKADVLPIAALADETPTRRPGWFKDVASVDVNHGGYVAYWSDRAWSSLNPESSERRRRLFDGELREILDSAEIDDVMDADEVVVYRYDMFWEGEPHLRGMIRNRGVEELDLAISDAEDAVNPNFHAGPPRQIALEPPN